jgi:hypothetical protein
VPGKKGRREIVFHPTPIIISLKNSAAMDTPKATS